MINSESYGLLFLLILAVWFSATSNAKETSDHVIYPVIGIHLGTTYSSVGAYKNLSLQDGGSCSDRWGRPYKHNGLSPSDLFRVIPIGTQDGSKAMPSCVAFTDDDDDGVLIGQPAKNQELLNPNRTICGINRLLGRRFDDPEFQSYIWTLPYKVVNKENKPHIQVEFKNGETKEFSPEDICAMLLGRLKEIAETFLGIHDIKRTTVLVHQSYFNREVLRGLSKACVTAGFEVSQVGTSKIAVYVSNFSRSKTLIYDLGGSAFGAFFIEDHQVISSKEDEHLGGQTFDTRLVNHFVNLIETKYNKDISHDLNALTKLRIECEKAKITLSTSDRAMIKIVFGLVDDEMWVFEETLTREKFEELNMDLFNRTMDMVKGAIEGGGIEKTEIEDVYVVGGSSEIPMVKQLVKNYFGKDPMNVDVVNPNEALAVAATRHAGTFGLECVEPVGVYNDLAVGIETIGGVMMRLAEPGILYSAMSSNVTTYYDGQTTIVIKVFEGLRWLTKYCHYLGNLQISSLPPAPRGVTIVEVSVEVIEDGKIRVSAEHKATENKVSMIIPREERHTDRKVVQQYYDDKNYCSQPWEYTNMKEDQKVMLNIGHTATVLKLQPRSMGFAPLQPHNIFHHNDRSPRFWFS